MNKIVVLLKTCYWVNKKGLHQKRSLLFRRRQCEGFNALEEDAKDVGAEIMADIVNLDECADGVYEVVTCDEDYDYSYGWEPVCFDYNFKLVPLSSNVPEDSVIGEIIEKYAPSCPWMDEVGIIDKKEYQKLRLNELTRDGNGRVYTNIKGDLL
jgi:hypothetical protein